MLRLVRKFPLCSFYLLAVLIVCGVVAVRLAYARYYEAEHGAPLDYYDTLFATIEAAGFDPSWVNIVSITAAALQYPIYFGIFVFAGAPSIAALVVTAAVDGWRGVKQLLGRLKPWRDAVTPRRALGVYAIIVAAYLAAMAGFAGLTVLYAGPEALRARLGAVGGTPLIFVAFFLAGAFLEEGGTLEELGWRGFALPRLMDRMRSPLVASLWLGVLWTAWHFPREVPGLVSGGPWGELAWGQFLFLVSCMSLSVVITLAFNQTGGSVIPAIMIHGLFVHSSRVVDYAALSEHTPWSFVGDIRTAVMALVAVGVVAGWGPNLGRLAAESSERTTSPESS